MSLSNRVIAAEHVGAALVTEEFAPTEIPQALFDVAASLLVAGAFRQKPVICHATSPAFSVIATS
jgi:hypothetical protein